MEKVTSLIRLAQKGRMLQIGKTAVSILIKRKRAFLVIIAADASDKLKHQIELECRRTYVPVFIFSNKDDLGKLCNRESVATLAIADKNMAAGIKKALS